MKVKILITAFLAVLLTALSVIANDPPHNDASGVSCGECHGQVLFCTDPDAMDPEDLRLMYDDVCLRCHKFTDSPYHACNGPLAGAHQSVKCIDCHHPHYQTPQLWYGRKYYQSEYEIAYGAGSVTGTETLPVIGLVTEITFSSISFKSGWTLDDLEAKTSEGRGMLFLPNRNSPYNSLMIYSVSDSGGGTGTIKVKGSLGSVSTSGFAVAYGQAVKRDIPYASVSDEPVLVFDHEGRYGFAHNDGQAGGNDSTPNGICQVCHTETNHWRSDGTYSDDHFSGQNCTKNCHKHTNGFVHGGSGGENCIDCHNTGSHVIHLDPNDPRGPNITCDDCHDFDNMPYFKSGTGTAPYDLSETTVCDTCHSPGGSYDGIADAAVGAKTNWSSNIYESDKVTLQAGKEKWCATCHDESPSLISGVNAPNVIGDEDDSSYNYGTIAAGWGYYKTGHGLANNKSYPASGGLTAGAGVSCDSCHDYFLGHIDGLARTYERPSGSTGYQSGYRLKSVDGEIPLEVPHLTPCFTTPLVNVDDFRLCFSCHDSEPFTNSDSKSTNFRNDSSGINSHNYHLGLAYPCGGGGRWSSDWSGTIDSKPSCMTCHNVHGSTQLSMVRDGKLVDREPGLVVFYDDDNDDANGIVTYQNGGPGAHSPTPPDKTLDESTGTIYVPYSGTPYLCSTCHYFGGYSEYPRTPYDADAPPYITAVFGQEGSSLLRVEFSKAVVTNSNGTGDLLPSDFNFDDADNNRSITGVTHAAGSTFAVLTLSSALDGIDDIDTDTIAAATAASIYDLIGKPMGTDAVVISGDADPPVVSNQSPANGEDGIRVYSNVTFTLSDSGTGVDWSTVTVDLNGDLGYAKSYPDPDGGIVSKRGLPAEYAVTVNPETDFSGGEVITVTVNGSDLLGNAMTPVEWDFTTIPGGGPYTDVLHPTDVAAAGSYTTYGGLWVSILDQNDGDNKRVTSGTGASGGIENQFYVDMDDLSATDPSIQMIRFHVYARYIVAGGEPVSCYQGDMRIGYKTGTNTVWEGATYIDGCPDYVLVSSDAYTTDSDGGSLDLADINNLQIAVERLISGGYQLRVTEVYAEITYGIPDGDVSPPEISGLNPENEATGVSIANGLTFTLSDSGGGLDWSTFQIQLTGSDGYSKLYTDESDVSIVSKTGSMASYEVTVQPDENFGYSEVISVDVDVDDNSGNALVSPAWSFTTEEETVPVMQTLHPSGLGVIISDSRSEVTPVGGDWAEILDANDSDTTHVYLLSRFDGGGPTVGQHAAGFKLEMDDAAGMDTISEVRAYFVFRFDTPGGGPPGTHDTITLTLDTGGPSEITQEYQYEGDVTGYTTISISSTNDPDGGSWELADIQNLRAGFKLETREGVGWITTYAWVTEVYLEIDP